MAEGEGGLPEFVEDKKKSRFNVFGKKKNKGSGKSPHSQAWTEMDEKTMTPHRELMESGSGKGGGKKGSRKKSGSKKTTPNPQLYETPPHFNAQEDTSVPGQCDSTSPIMVTHLGPLTIPVTVNNDRVVELDEPLEAESIKKLQHNLSEAMKKLERAEADNRAKEGQLKELNQLKGFKVQKKRLEEELKTKEDQLNATSVELHQLKKKIEHKDKELEDVQNQSKQKLEEEQAIRTETEQQHRRAELEREKKLTDLQALKTTEVELLKKEIDGLKSEVKLKEQSLEEQREEFEAQLRDVRKQKEEFEAQLREQKEAFEAQLRDVREQKEAFEAQLCDVREQKEEFEAQLREQKEAFEAQLRDVREQKEEFEAQLHYVHEADTIIVENQSSLSSQSNEGAGASSLSEEDKKVAQLTEQLLDKEDEVEKLTKQLQVKTSEVSSLEDKKAQLEQQLTHTVLVQKEEYDKELQGIRAERKHYKTIEAQNSNIQGEIQRLKHELLSVKVSRQGEETIADLQQQLREKDDRIHGLMKASEEKTALVDESYRALNESTEKFEREIEKQSYQIEQQTKEYKDELEKREHTIMAGGLAIQKLKQDKESDVMAARKELEERCKELEQHLTRANEENKSIEREKEKIVKSSKQFQSEHHEKIQEKEQVVQELNHELLKSRIEFRAAQEQHHDLQGELSLLQQQMTDLRDVSEGKGKRIQQLSDQIDTDKKKLSELEEELTVAREQLSELEEELTVAREQNTIFQEDITRSVKEEKGARQVIAQLQSELEKNKQVLSKSGKKSLDELRRSYEELKEQTEEEKVITERQVRAYKKQVDELSEKLTEANDKTKLVQDRCDELVKVETERNEMKAKVHTLKENEEKLNDMLHGKVIRESELEEKLENMKAGNKVLKLKKDTFEKELEQANKACTLYQTQLATEKANHHETHVIMTQEMDKMRNANIVLQQRMKEAWLQVDKLQDEILNLKTSRANLPPPPQSHSQSPYGFTPHSGRSRHNDPQVYHTNKTIEADIALQEAEVARQQLEATRRTGQLHGINAALPLNQRGSSGSPQSKRRYPVNPEDAAKPIRENPVIEGIDREIHDVAEGIRRMTRPPLTQEIQQDDGNSDIPYDPNLTCPGCGQRYRFGEIQKLRRHVNEFCPARDKYTRQF